MTSFFTLEIHKPLCMKRVLLPVFIAFCFLPNLLIAQTTPWPEWVFHHWVWEDESTQQSALQLIDDYKAHDIPVGAIIIDSPWETGYNSFDWDTTLYPDAQAMVDSFHARDVRVVVWMTTAINTDMTELWHYADSMGYFMKANAGSSSAVINWWKGDGSMIDFFNPDAVAWWKSLMDKTLALGIDGWKCDGTDYSVFLGNALYSPGAGQSITRASCEERRDHGDARTAVPPTRPAPARGDFEVDGLRREPALLPRESRRRVPEPRRCAR